MFVRVLASRQSARRTAVGDSSDGGRRVNLSSDRKKVSLNLPKNNKLLIYFHFWRREPVYSALVHMKVHCITTGDDAIC